MVKSTGKRKTMLKLPKRKLSVFQTKQILEQEKFGRNRRGITQ